MTVSFPSGHSWHFPSSLFPPISGVPFPLQGKCELQNSGSSPVFQEEPRSSLLPQPEISEDEETGKSATWAFTKPELAAGCQVMLSID